MYRAYPINYIYSAYLYLITPWRIQTLNNRFWGSMGIQRLGVYSLGVYRARVTDSGPGNSLT